MFCRYLFILSFLLFSFLVKGQGYLWTKVNQNSNYVFNTTGGGFRSSSNALTDGVATYQLINFSRSSSIIWGPGYASYHVFCRDSTGKQTSAIFPSSTNSRIVPYAIDNNHVLHSLVINSFSGSMGGVSSATTILQHYNQDGTYSASGFLGSDAQGNSDPGSSDTYFNYGRLCVDETGADYISTDKKAYSVTGGALRWHQMSLKKFNSPSTLGWSKSFGDTAKVTNPNVYNSYATVGFDQGNLYVSGTLKSDSFWYDGLKHRAAEGLVLLRFDTSGAYQGFAKVFVKPDYNFAGFDGRGNMLLTFIVNANSTIRLDTLLSVTAPTFGNKHTIIACINPKTGRCLWYSTLYSTLGITQVNAIQKQSVNMFIISGNTDTSMLINGTSYLFGKEMFRAEMDSNGNITLLHRNPIVVGGNAYPLSGWKTPGGDLLITDFIYGGNNYPYSCDTVNAGSLVMARYISTPTYPVPQVSASAHVAEPLYQTQATLRWKAGSGRGRLLILSNSATVTAHPANGVDYLSNTIYGQGAIIGPNTYVVGNTTDTFVTVTGLSPGSRYYAKIVEYNGCGGRIVYETGGDTFNFQTPLRTYYSKPTGDIHQLSTWGHLPNGSGSSPLSFSGDSTTYVLSNVSQVHIRTSNFVITGRGTRFIVGDSITNVHLQIDDTISFSAPVLQITPYAQITIRGRCLSSRLQGDSLSTIQLYESKQVPNQIQAFKLIIKGGPDLIPLRSVVVYDTLELDGRVTSNSFTLGTDSLHPGVLLYRSGCIQSSGSIARYIPSTVSSGHSGLFPLAFYSSFPTALSERFVNVRYTSAPFKGGTLRVNYLQGSTLSETGLPLLDTSGSDSAIITRVNPNLFSFTNSGIMGGRLTIEVTDSNISRNALSDLRLLRRTSTNRWSLAGNYSVNSGTTLLPQVKASDVVSLNTGTTNFAVGIDDSTFYQVLLGKPTQQATSLYVADVLNNRMLLRWKRGNGYRCMVIARRLSPVNTFPTDSITYTASSSFGTPSTNLGSQNFVLYTGSLDSVWVTSLANNTRYHFAVLEYNGYTGAERYLTSQVSIATDSTRSMTYYYNKAGQPINKTGSWGLLINGGGDTLPSFARSNIVYRLYNDSLVTISDTFIVNGQNAYVETHFPITVRITPTGLWQFTGASHSVSLTQHCKMILEGRLICNGLSADYLELNSPFLNRSLVKYPTTAVWGISSLRVKGGYLYELPRVLVRDSLFLNGILNNAVMFDNVGPFAGRITFIQHEYGLISQVSHQIRQDTSNVYFFPLGVIDTSTAQVKFQFKPATIKFLTYQNSIFNGRYFTMSNFKLTGPSSWQNLTDSAVSPVQVIGKTYPTGIVWKSTFGFPDENYTPLVNVPYEVSIADTTLPGMANINGLALYQVASSRKLEGARGNYSTSSGRYTISRKQLIGGWSPANTDVYFGMGVDTTIVQLPVTWLSFTGKNEASDVVLHWSTSSEINNSHFEIERSTDGFNFTYVGREKGNGTTNSINGYGFTDRDAFSKAIADVLYYRLKQVDYNGDFEYSRTIAINRSGQSNDMLEIFVYPNPFTQDLKLTLNNVSEGDVMVEVFDLSGRKYLTQTQVSGQGTLTLDLSSLSSLAKGVYILNVRNAGNLLQQKLVKLR